MTRFTRIIQDRRKERFSRPKFGAKIKINTKQINISIFLLLIILGFAYLALINNVSTGGFEIKDLEQKIEVLKEANKKLELEATGLESMSVIAETTEQLSLTKGTAVEYLEVVPPYVALGE